MKFNTARIVLSDGHVDGHVDDDNDDDADDVISLST